MFKLMMGTHSGKAIIMQFCLWNITKYIYTKNENLGGKKSQGTTPQMWHITINIDTHPNTHTLIHS